MKKNYKKTKINLIGVLLLSLFFIPNWLQAQWVHQSSYIKNPVDACDEAGAAWHVKVTPATDVTEITFVVDFPLGVHYVALEEITGYGITTTALPGDNQVTITVPDLAISESVEFNIFRAVECGVVGPLVDQMTINYNGGATYVISSDDQAPKGSGVGYQVNVPNVVIASVTPTPAGEANIGDVVSHEIVVENRGQNSVIDNFYVELQYTDFELDPNSVPAEGVLNAAGNRIDFPNLTALDDALADGFDVNESYTFTLQGKLKSCGNNATYKAGYTCFDKPSCKPSNALSIASPIAIGFPDMTLTVVSNQQAAFGCTDITGQVDYTFTNDGTETFPGSGFARVNFVDVGGYWGDMLLFHDLNATLGKAVANAGLTGVFTSDKTALPAAMLQDGGGRYRVDFSNLTDAVLAAKIGLQDVDGDGIYSELPIGATFALAAENEFPCARFSYVRNAARVVYDNQCSDNLKLDNKSPGNPIANLGTNIRNLIAPTDIDVGALFELAVTAGVYFNPDEYQGCNNMYQQLELTSTVPLNIDDINIVDLYNRTITPSLDATGKILTLKISFRKGDDNQYINTYEQSLYALKIQGLKVISCDGGQYLDLAGRLSYVCEDCATCEWDYYNDLVSATVLHNCGNPCTGVSTVSLEAKRTTLGWKDQADYEAGNPPFADDTGLLHLNTLATYDIIKAEAVGKVGTTPAGGYPTVGVDFVYSNNHTFEYVEGTAELTVAATGTTYIGTINTATAATIGDDKSINISSNDIAFVGLPAGYKYQTNDMLKVVASLKLIQAPSETMIPLEKFRVNYYGLNTTGDKETCEGYGKQLFTRQTLGRFGPRSISIRDADLRGCEVQTVGMVYTIGGYNVAAYSDANEYRPSHKVTKAEFDLPPGFEYVQGSARIKYYANSGYVNYPISGGPDPVALAAGTVSLQDDGSWPPASLRGGSGSVVMYAVVIDIVPKLGARAFDGQMEMRGEAVDLLYMPDNVKTETISMPTKAFTYTPHNISHTTPAAQQALNKEVSWSMTYTNSLDQAINNGWFKITSPSGHVQLLSVTEEGTPLNIVSDLTTPNIWYAHTASLQATSSHSFEIKAQTTHCDNDKLVMDYIYSCDVMPTTFAEFEVASANPLDPVDLELTQVTTSLQAQTLAPASTAAFNLCEDVEYVFEIKNGDIGTLYNTVLNVDLPPYNTANNEYPLEFVAGSLEVMYYDLANDAWGVWKDPAGDAGYHLAGANTADFYINTNELGDATSANLAVDGLLGNGRMRIKMKLTTTCSHISGTGPIVLVNAEKPCGDASNYTNAVAPVIKIRGANTAYTAILTLDVDTPLDYCAGDSLDGGLEVLMVGGASSNGDILEFTLPAQVKLSTPTLDYDINSDGTMDGQVIVNELLNQDGSTTVTWNMESNIAGGDNIKYFFNIVPADSQTLGKSSTIVSLNSVYKTRTSLSCGATSCPDSYAAAGTSDKELELVSTFCLKAYNDINQTPQGLEVGGDVLTNDYNVVDIVSAQYYDASGNPQSLTFGTATNVYGKDVSGNWMFAGTIALNANGKYTFTPDPAFAGDVPIDYTGKNGVGATDIAILDIKVMPTPDGGINTLPRAQNDNYTVEQSQNANLNILGNDIDIDIDGYNLVVTAVELRDGYTTSSGGAGTTVAVGVISDVYDGVTKVGTLVVDQNGGVVFDPKNNFVGDVPFDYTIADSHGGEDTAIATITVLPSNTTNDVFANDDANTGVKGVILTGNIVTNDFDPERNSFTVTLIDTDGDGTPDAAPGEDISITQNGAQVGKLTLTLDGNYTWNPNYDFVGTVVLPYQIVDQSTTDVEATGIATLYLTNLPFINCGFFRPNRNEPR